MKHKLTKSAIATTILAIVALILIWTTSYPVRILEHFWIILAVLWSWNSFFLNRKNKIKVEKLW